MEASRRHAVCWPPITGRQRRMPYAGPHHRSTAQATRKGWPYYRRHAPTLSSIVGPPLAGGLGRPEVNASGATPCGWPVCSLVCLFAGLFARWSVCSLVCLFAGLLVLGLCLSLVCLVAGPFVRWSVCSLVCLFAGLFVRWPALAGLFVRWSVCLLAGVGWSVCSLVCLLAGRRWLVCLYLYRNDIMPGQCVSAPHLFVRRRRWWREF